MKYFFLSVLLLFLAATACTEQKPATSETTTLTDNEFEREKKAILAVLKRETRLMEKVAGRWKIAGMHMTIYGK